MTQVVLLLAIFIFAFIIGSIPFAQIFAKQAGIDDLRTVGSKNPGIANLYRLAGGRYARWAALSDGLKGATPVFMVNTLNLSPWFSVMAGAFAILGHNYSPFLKFRGGKGLAAGTGMLFVFMPIPTLVFVCIAGVIYRYWLHWVPGSSMVLLSMHFLYALYSGQPKYVIVTPIVVGVLAFIAWFQELITNPKNRVPPALRNDGSEY